MKRRGAMNPKVAIGLCAAVAVVGLGIAASAVLDYRGYQAIVSDSELAVGTIREYSKGGLMRYRYTVDGQQYSGEDVLVPKPDSPDPLTVGGAVSVLYQRTRHDRSVTPYSSQGSAWRIPVGLGLVVFFAGMAGIIVTRRRLRPASEGSDEPASDLSPRP